MLIQAILFLLCISLPLCAEEFTFDPSSRTIEMPAPRKTRVDVFDFSGSYPELEKIVINARRKKHVEFFLSGEYPLLERVVYEGSFGVLNGKLTGKFPRLSEVIFSCTNCAMEFNLNGTWERSCDIQIRGADQDIILELPKDLGLIVHTKTAVKGKVYPNEQLRKVNRFGYLNKTFANELAQTAPIVLTIHIEGGEGRIFLK